MHATGPGAWNTTRNAAAARLSSRTDSAGCRRGRRAAATTTTATAKSEPRRSQRGTVVGVLLLLFVLALSPVRACDDRHGSDTAAAPTPWPDAVSPATRRRLTAAAPNNNNHHHPWEQPLGRDRHGRRRSLLTSTLRRCGTHAPEPASRQRLERAHAVRAAREAAYVPAAGATPRTIEVPTYVTLVDVDDADVSDSAIHAQLDALNKAYGTTPGSPVKWAFALKALTRVKVGSPGMCDPKVEAQVKKDKRQGGPGALNLYIADLSDCGLLGFSSWPWDLGSSSKGDPTADGVTIHYATLPGGSYKPYNKGYTSIHEVGHWFGLYHVFENGCTGAGDSVDDTNYVATPTEGCPKARDTCAQQPGGDPVTNPMDYTDDACMQTFTVGQQIRMESLYRMYRGGGGGTSA